MLRVCDILHSFNYFYCLWEMSRVSQRDSTKIKYCSMCRLRGCFSSRVFITPKPERVLIKHAIPIKYRVEILLFISACILVQQMTRTKVANVAREERGYWKPVET